MIRLLPRTPRGTWLLAAAVWLACVGVLWWVLPYRPRAAWPTEEPAVVHGFIPGTAVVLTSMPWSSTIDGPPGPMLGPLVARDAATGEVREWFPDGERLTLVDPGVDGKHVLVGRVIDGRARLFLHDAADGKVIAELPRGGPRAENENDQPADAYEQFAVFRPDGRQIAYADRVDNQTWLRLWDLETKEVTAGLPEAGPLAAWSPDGRLIAYAAEMRQAWGVPWAIHVWDLNTGHVGALGSSPIEKHRPTHIRFSPDGKSVVSALQGHANELRGPPEKDEIAGWDAASGTQTFRREIRKAGFPANVPWFATYEWSDEPGNLCVHRCDYATGMELDGIVLHEIAAASWDVFSPDGSLVLGHERIDNPVFEFLDQHVLQRALGTNVRPVIWDAGSGRLRYALPMALDPAVRIQMALNGDDFRTPTWKGWSPDGTLLAIAGETTLAVWDVPPRKRLSWFAAGAVLLALPIVVFARRRARAVGLL